MTLKVRTDHCLNGWPSPKPCNWTGGCYCDRTRGHKGRCRCACGSTHETNPGSPHA